MPQPKPRLCAAGARLRAQVNRSFPYRDKTSDGWIGDARHAATPSDHNPDAEGIVRAIDIDADLSDKPASTYLADQLRLAAKSGDRRIAYIIHAGKIASPKARWAWRPYDGLNPHHKHLHVSFTRAGDDNGDPFTIPMLQPKKGTR